MAVRGSNHGYVTSSRFAGSFSTFVGFLPVYAGSFPPSWVLTPLAGGKEKNIITFDILQLPRRFGRVGFIFIPGDYIETAANL